MIQSISDIEKLSSASSLKNLFLAILLDSWVTLALQALTNQDKELELNDYIYSGTLSMCTFSTYKISVKSQPFILLRYEPGSVQ